MKSLEEVKAEGMQLAKAAKIIAKKSLQLKAELSALEPKISDERLEGIRRACFYLDMHADELYLDLQKL